jgi:NADH-ubiquinone oxidoreductase chain 5
MEVVILFDWISLFFLSTVLLISSIVLLYRNSYMEEDKSFKRFIYIVLLFVFSMASLILSPNIIRIILGWDGLGLVSYCLVIYYQNIKSYRAGIITVLSNRLGDVALLIRIGLLVDIGM